MKSAIILIALIVLVFGCIGPKPPEKGNDQNNSDSNAFDSLLDINKILGGGKPISVNFDQNTIKLNFDFDLNAIDPDTNLLAQACSTSCDIIDANKWSLVKDINYNVFACYCTKTFCYDEESETQITRYCRDNTIGLKIVN